MDKDLELLKVDYEKTTAYIFHLSEIRFKLLGLLPVVTGIAFFFSEQKLSPEGIFVIGVLGMIVTAGILFYDQRNTEIYERLIARAKGLEKKMQLPPVIDAEENGGVFSNRPGRGRMFLGVFKMWHDKGLAMVYTASAGVWSYMIFRSLIQIFDVETQLRQIPVILAIIVSWFFYKALIRLDKEKK